jgi:elongation factor G
MPISPVDFTESLQTDTTEFGKASAEIAKFFWSASMPKYKTADIRNIALVGHTHAGKTSLAEAVLHKAGVTTRLGNVNDGTSYLDCTEDAKERKCSIDSAACFVNVDGIQINIMDTPGSLEFIGPAIATLAGVETAVVVVSAAAGIEVNTRRMMKRAKDLGLGRMLVVNKMGGDNVDLEELVRHLQETFGNECQPINLPSAGRTAVVDCYTKNAGQSDFSSVEDAHTAVVEGIVGADDALMEKYFAGELSPEELAGAASKSVAAGTFVPILFTSSTKDIGIDHFINVIKSCAPSPEVGLKRKIKIQEDETEIAPKPDGHFVGQVFKVATDPKSNIKFSFIRVHSGTLKHDSDMHVGQERKGHRPGHLYKIQAADHADLDEGIAGDIIAVGKLDLHIGTIVTTGPSGTIDMPAFPHPMYSLAIEPKSRGDAGKVSGALAKFQDEDPCFKADRDEDTGQLVIHGVGDVHLRTILAKMKRYSKLEVDTQPPKIPYRETITALVKDVEYTHKKQSGGAGQFGRVIISIEPNERGAGYEFIDEIFGGAIDQVFRPSVDKGIRAQMKIGCIAGYPIVDVKVRLIDGKTHPVDSKDIAFQMAGKGAFKKAFDHAKPIILEPIVELEVTVPANNLGDIQGDLASRRGRPVGQEMLPGNLSILRAQVPLAEVSDYSSRLSSITGGQGSFSMEFSHYDPVPGNIKEQIIANSKKAAEEEHH